MSNLPQISNLSKIQNTGPNTTHCEYRYYNNFYIYAYSVRRRRQLTSTSCVDFLHLAPLKSCRHQTTSTWYPLRRFYNHIESTRLTFGRYAFSARLATPWYKQLCFDWFGSWWKVKMEKKLKITNGTQFDYLIKELEKTPKPCKRVQQRLSSIQFKKKIGRKLVQSWMLLVLRQETVMVGRR